MADPTGNRAHDAEKRGIMENLLGEVPVKAYPDKRELELDLSINAEALPNVLRSDRAKAYILVAGACFALFRQLASGIA